MIEWIYSEEEKLVTDSKKEMVPGNTSMGTFRKQLQDVQEKRNRRRRKIVQWGKNVFAIGAACLLVFYFKNTFYEFDGRDYDIYLEKEERASEEFVLPATSDQVIVEELAGNVKELPLTKSAPEATTLPTQTPIPIQTPVPTQTPTPTQEPTPTKEPTPTPSPTVLAEAEIKEYRVQEGDTIAKISRDHYGTMDMIEEICELNKISDGDYIQEGEILVLP